MRKARQTNQAQPHQVARPRNAWWRPAPGILFITILMAEFGARDGAVDQASVGIVVGERSLGSGAHSEVEEPLGHRRYDIRSSPVEPVGLHRRPL